MISMIAPNRNVVGLDPLWESLARGDGSTEALRPDIREAVERAQRILAVADDLHAAFGEGVRIAVCKGLDEDTQMLTYRLVDPMNSNNEMEETK